MIFGSASALTYFMLKIKQVMGKQLKKLLLLQKIQIIRYMKRFLFASLAALLMAGHAGAQQDTTFVTIQTNVGTMKARLYDDVPGHVRAFIARAEKGEYDGTLFTRVIENFMIQGGAPDSRNALPGRRCGFGDRSAEIPPEMNPKYFHKRGALAAPRQPDEINPERKSDMSQFFIVQGKVYRGGELDTLEKVKNYPARKRALQEFYYPVKTTLDSLRKADAVEYNKWVVSINAKIDSVVQAYPDHLIFTPEQRAAYTTVGGSHHLDGYYTIYGELTEGFDVLDLIASQKKDRYDRPVKDIRIIKVSVEK